MAKRRARKKEKEIQDIAAHLFSCHGYHSTSMREIARETRMNPSSLYHYFSSKEDLLFNLMNDAMDEALETLNCICIMDLLPQEKLKKILAFYTRYYAGDQERLVLLVNEMYSLSEEHRRVLITKQRSYVNLIRAVLDELAKENKMKAVHPTVATFSFFGMVHYTVKWYRKEGPVDLDELADTFVEIFTGGILK